MCIYATVLAGDSIEVKWQIVCSTSFRQLELGVIGDSDLLAVQKVF